MEALDVSIALQRSYEQKFFIEEKMVKEMILCINNEIMKHASQGKTSYEFHVPVFRLGYPRYDVHYITNKLRNTYRSKGFQVHEKDALWTSLSWEALRTTTTTGTLFYPRDTPLHAADLVVHPKPPARSHVDL